jgi:phospholipid-binding lipoprotein MlaA
VPPLLGVLALLAAVAAPGWPARAEPSPALEDEAWAEAQPAPDPWEALNRRLFDLNLSLYDGLLEPVFRIYTTEVPEGVQQALRNLVDTARQPFSALTSASAGRWPLSRDYLRRFGVNATFGLLGTLDVASEVGIPRRDAYTVGDVLCRYAVPPGPYVVLPFFGPTNLRGTAGRAGDIALSVYALGDLYPPYIVGTNIQRYERIRTSRNALEGALDPYVLARTAFTQLDQRCGSVP